MEMDMTMTGDPPRPATLREVQEMQTAAVLQFYAGNQRASSRALGVSRWTLARLVRKFRNGSV